MMLLSAIRRMSDVFSGENPAATGVADGGGDVDAGDREPRAAPRHETQITATLCAMGQARQCVIRNLSTRGMTIATSTSDLCVGMQVLVTCETVPTLCGTVRWFRGDAFGIELVKPLSFDQVYKMRQAVPAGMQPRAGRARVTLPAFARFADQAREVEVLNLSVGGLMMRSAMLPKVGQGLMIEFRDLLPMGGHVRWSNAGTCGVMFSKLLSVPVAEELARRAWLSEGWLEEVRMVHAMALAA